MRKTSFVTDTLATRYPLKMCSGDSASNCHAFKKRRGYISQPSPSHEEKLNGNPVYEFPYVGTSSLLSTPDKISSRRGFWLKVALGGRHFQYPQRIANRLSQGRSHATA